MKKHLKSTPKLKLEGESDNATSIITRARMAARNAGESDSDVNALTKDMLTGNRDRLLQVVKNNFEVE